MAASVESQEITSPDNKIRASEQKNEALQEMIQNSSKKQNLCADGKDVDDGESCGQNAGPVSGIPAGKMLSPGSPERAKSNVDPLNSEGVIVSLGMGVGTNQTGGTANEDVHKIESQVDSEALNRELQPGDGVFKLEAHTDDGRHKHDPQAGDDNLKPDLQAHEAALNNGLQTVENVSKHEVQEKNNTLSLSPQPDVDIPKQKVKRGDGSPRHEVKKSDNFFKQDVKTASGTSKPEVKTTGGTPKIDVKTTGGTPKIDVKTAGSTAKLEFKTGTGAPKLESRTFNSIKLETKSVSGILKPETKAEIGAAKLETRTAMLISRLEAKTASATAKPELKAASGTHKLELKTASATPKPEVKTASGTTKPEARTAHSTSKYDIKLNSFAVRSEDKAASATAKSEVKTASGTPRSEVKTSTGTFKSEVKMASGTFKSEVKTASGTAKSEVKTASGTAKSEVKTTIGTPRSEVKASTGTPKPAANSTPKLEIKSFFGTAKPVVKSTSITSKPDVRKSDGILKHIARISGCASKPETKISHGTSKLEGKKDGGIPKSEIRTDGGIPKSQVKTDGGIPKSEVKTDGGIPKSEVKTDAGIPKSEVKTDGGIPKSEIKTDVVASKHEGKYKHNLEIDGDTSKHDLRKSGTLLESDILSDGDTPNLSLKAESKVPQIVLQSRGNIADHDCKTDDNIPELDAHADNVISQHYTKIDDNNPIFDPQPVVNIPKLDPLTDVNIPKLDPETDVNIPKLDSQTEVSIPELDPQTEVSIPELDPQTEVSIPKLNPQTDVNILPLDPQTDVSILSIPKLDPKTDVNILKLDSQTDVNILKLDPQIDVNTPTHDPQTDVNIPKHDPQTDVNTPKLDPQTDVNILKLDPKTDVNILKLDPPTDVNIPKLDPPTDVNTPKLDPQTDVNILKLDPETDVNVLKLDPKTDVNMLKLDPPTDVNIPKLDPQTDVNIPKLDHQTEVNISELDPETEANIPQHDPQIDFNTFKLFLKADCNISKLKSVRNDEAGSSGGSENFSSASHNEVLLVEPTEPTLLHAKEAAELSFKVAPSLINICTATLKHNSEKTELTPEKCFSDSKTENGWEPSESKVSETMFTLDKSEVKLELSGGNSLTVNWMSSDEDSSQNIQLVHKEEATNVFENIVDSSAECEMNAESRESLQFLPQTSELSHQAQSSNITFDNQIKSPGNKLSQIKPTLGNFMSKVSCNDKGTETENTFYYTLAPEEMLQFVPETSFADSVFEESQEEHSDQLPDLIEVMDEKPNPLAFGASVVASGSANEDHEKQLEERPVREMLVRRKLSESTDTNTDRPVLETLTFGPGKSCEASNEEGAGAESSADVCVCPLCDRSYPGDNKDMLAHLVLMHKFVIADVNYIANLPAYLRYWKARFLEKPFFEFCSKIVTNSGAQNEVPREEFHLLCDALPEDKNIREHLQRKKLESVLAQQQKEREETKFCRQCLFCKQTFCGNRAVLFDHLLRDHTFHMGQPDNLVYTDELFDLIQSKLDNQLCLFCEKSFKDKASLREHMRKKQHRKINPKNKEYDRFYIVNYMEMGKNWESLQSEDNRLIKSTEKDTDEEEEWSGWTEESESKVVCLFCDLSCLRQADLQEHMKNRHSFDLLEVNNRLQLNFYQKVKLINFIRRQVYHKTCYGCQQVSEDSEKLLAHFDEFPEHIKKIPDSEIWDQPQYFFPTYEDDCLLCQLDDDDEGAAGDALGVMVISESIPVTDTILKDQKLCRDLLKP